VSARPAPPPPATGPTSDPPIEREPSPRSPVDAPEGAAPDPTAESRPAPPVGGLAASTLLGAAPEPAWAPDRSGDPGHAGAPATIDGSGQRSPEREPVGPEPEDRSIQELFWGEI
jgi:hypothetical protein